MREPELPQRPARKSGLDRFRAALTSDLDEIAGIQAAMLRTLEAQPEHDYLPALQHRLAVMEQQIRAWIEGVDEIRETAPEAEVAPDLWWRRRRQLRRDRQLCVAILPVEFRPERPLTEEQERARRLACSERKPVPRSIEVASSLLRLSADWLHVVALYHDVPYEHGKEHVAAEVGRRLENRHVLASLFANALDVCHLRLLARILYAGELDLDDPSSGLGTFEEDWEWYRGSRAPGTLLRLHGLVFVATSKGRRVVYVPVRVRGDFASVLISRLRETDADDAAELVADLHTVVRGDRILHESRMGPCTAALPTRSARYLVPASGPDRIFELDVVLRGVELPVRRRIRVSYLRSLGALHEILILAFGWSNRGTHYFSSGAGRKLWTEPMCEVWDYSSLSEWKASIRSALRGIGTEITWAYDVPDAWDHRIRVAAIHAPDRVEVEPCVVYGEGAIPEEGLEAARGYAEFLRALRDPTHPRHAELRARHGDPYDTVPLDFDDVNQRLRRLQ